jgi:hypothetical protein
MHKLIELLVHANLGGAGGLAVTFEAFPAGFSHQEEEITNLVAVLAALFWGPPSPARPRMKSAAGKTWGRGDASGMVLSTKKITSGCIARGRQWCPLDHRPVPKPL